MSRFRTAPRKGHLEQLKHIYGYLRLLKSAAIRVRVDEPDFSTLPIQDFDWAETVYGKVQEEFPKDIPEPHGKPAVSVHYVDANLYHNIVTGRSVTGILHFCNQKFIELFSKSQACVHTATFGSEFVAAMITLRYLGVPVKERSFLFGYNQAVVTNSVIPHSTLSKRHNALSYHRVCEATIVDNRHYSEGAKLIAIFAISPNFYWIDGKINPADIISKHWAYPHVWHMLQPILLYSGDTKTLLKDNNPNSKTSSTESKKINDNGVEKLEPIKVKIRMWEKMVKRK
jgi:hypothetical protein